MVLPLRAPPPNSYPFHFSKPGQPLARTPDRGRPAPHRARSASVPQGLSISFFVCSALRPKNYLSVRREKTRPPHGSLLVTATAPPPAPRAALFISVGFFFGIPLVGKLFLMSLFLFYPLLESDLRRRSDNLWPARPPFPFLFRSHSCASDLCNSVRHSRERCPSSGGRGGVPAVLLAMASGRDD